MRFSPTKNIYKENGRASQWIGAPTKNIKWKNCPVYIEIFTRLKTQSLKIVGNIKKIYPDYFEIMKNEWGS